jgi:hypothetical protein
MAIVLAVGPSSTMGNKKGEHILALAKTMFPF